jgi:hypothetical protein
MSEFGFIICTRAKTPPAVKIKYKIANNISSIVVKIFEVNAPAAKIAHNELKVAKKCIRKITTIAIRMYLSLVLSNITCVGMSNIIIQLYKKI